MTDITAFPSFNPSEGGNVQNVSTFTAGAAITMGQVVAFATTGVSGTVHPAITDTTGQVIGVALYTVASGAKVAVALNGSIVKVANADDTATIDAGDVLVANDNAVGGTVSVATSVATASTLGAGIVVGIALDDIAASSYGRVLLSVGNNNL